jgi:hypothetical protein
MTTPIDCARMSHSSGFSAEEPELVPAATPPTSAASQAEPSRATYECVNECVSSLGVTALLSGAVAALGCSALPPACPIFVGASVGSLLGGCEAACEELGPRS